MTLKNGEKARPGELFIENIYEGESQSGWISEIRVIIHEGKFHQVKRMFEAVEMYVLYLKRIRMGNFSIGFRFSARSLSSFNNRRNRKFEKIKSY